MSDDSVIAKEQRLLDREAEQVTEYMESFGWEAVEDDRGEWYYEYWTGFRIPTDEATVYWRQKSHPLPF